MEDPTQGAPWAIWGRFEPFCQPQTLSWGHGGQNRDLGYVAQISIPRALFVVFTPENGPKHTPGPEFWLLPAHLAPLSETQHGVYHGPFLAILSHFAYPKPHFGRIVCQSCVPAVSWATWLKLQFRGHFCSIRSPTFCGFHLPEWP